MKANKIYILSLLSFMIFSSAAAQEFKTDESISEQLKKGTVPGTKISSAAPAKRRKDDTESKQKISVPVKQQLMKGTYPGLTIAKTSPGRSSATTAPAGKATLPSDSKPVAVEAPKAAVMPVMQEGKKEETPAPARKETPAISEQKGSSNK